jgi:hypothetical protein
MSGRRQDPLPVSIGVARMLEDGTLVLDLRAEDASGRRGDARRVYTKDHPRYRAVLEHLGGMKPGESKPVPPWPDRG